MGNNLWYFDQTSYEDMGHIDGVIHPFANAFFYEINAYGFNENDNDLVLKGTVNDFDIYVDRLYDIYIWMKQGIVSNCYVCWEG